MQTPSMVGKGHISGFAPFNVYRSCSRISTTIVDWLYWNKSENSWVSHCICIHIGELVFSLQVKQYSPFNQKLHNCIFSTVGKDAILIMWKISGRQLSSGAHRLPVQKLTTSIHRERILRLWKSKLLGMLHEVCPVLSEEMWQSEMLNQGTKKNMQQICDGFLLVATSNLKTEMLGNLGRIKSLQFWPQWITPSLTNILQKIAMCTVSSNSNKLYIALSYLEGNFSSEFITI